MKTRITLTSYYNSAGILATWHAGTGKHSMLFDNLEAVYNYFIGLFWEPVIIDRREQGRRTA